MFSSILPRSSSNKNYAQNGPAKNYTSQAPSRFSVQVFKTPATSAFPYPAKFDIGYRSAPQAEQHGHNWYPSSNQHPYESRARNGASYAIYPGVNTDTYIYEQSTCSKSDIFSNSDDSSSTTTFSPSSAFSPAMSTDSTVTLKSPAISERALEDQRVVRPSTPAPRPGYATHGPAQGLQSPSMARTLSNHHTHEVSMDTADERRSRTPTSQGHAATPIRVPVSSANLNETMTQVLTTSGGYNGLPEYAASSISELEVDERDRIAKINADYNAASSASFYTTSTGSSNESDGRRMSVSPPNLTNQPRDVFTRVASSQPLHPNLHFAIRPQEFDSNQATFQQSTPSVPYSSTRDSSPPTVERISSQLPPEYQYPPPNTQSSQLFPPLAHNDWSREATYNSDQTRVPPYRTSPQSIPGHPFDSGSTPSSRSAHATYATSQETGNLNEFRQDRPLPVPPPPGLPRQRSTVDRRSSVAGPRADAKFASDARSYGQTVVSDHRQHERSDPLSSSPREYSHEQPGLRHDSMNSPPRSGSSPPRDPSSRAALASEIRRDSRTPAPRESIEHRHAFPSRRDSAYVAESQKPSNDSRNRSQYTTDPRDASKAGLLSSSPTQVRLSPTDLDPAHSPRRLHTQPEQTYQRETLVVPLENDRSNERTRTRSTSFSNPTRPNISTQNHSSQLLSSQQLYAEPSRTADHDKPARSSDRSPPSRVMETSAYHSGYSESERRNDVPLSNSQPTYNGQIPPTTLSARDSHASQRQGPNVVQPSSKAADRAPVAMRDTTLSSRDAQSSRSRTSYVDPPPHPEPVRRHSDGDRPHSKAVSPPQIVTQFDKSVLAKHAGSDMPHAFPFPPEPQRRYSDGDQSLSSRPSDTGRGSVPLGRSVRWNDNLICPSPIFADQRRKGWFNRRGDQLWTNDGAYKPPAEGQEYPPDLEDYPDHGDGWMNEENIRIDLGHRLVPKPPLRSALKQAK
ncbi:hypothetical protein B0H34DRAFT_467465 [Crassisporium funariophilum]|nr:hypothetical protein B0H34DRAFT_467465 [Crassisporium funariophilum]